MRTLGVSEPERRRGKAVAVSGDRIVVGAEEADALGDGSGAAYVFAGGAGGWSEVQKLTANDGCPGDNFGRSVSIDGGRILIGAWLADGSASTTGAAYQFRAVGSAWELARKLNRVNGEYGDGFGTSVSISGDCGVVGAVNQNVGGMQNVGGAYYYCDLPGPIPPKLDLDIVCCVPVPDPLGPVVASVRIVNAGDETAIGRRWIEVVSPDGSAETAVGPETLALMPRDSISERHAFGLPDTLQRGSFVLRLRWQDAHGIRWAQAAATPQPPIR